jgi:transcriptional regulator GlxA family with amidase domain
VKAPYGGMTIAPEVSISQVKSVDVVLISSGGLELDDSLQRYAALLPWLKKQYAAGAYIAGICAGAAFPAEAGLLDGRRATTHWALAEGYAQRYPKVQWSPTLFVTEEARVLCSGGVSAAADISLYLVEKLCGHEVAVQTAKALLLSMPRTHQSGYAVLPLSPPHGDERIRVVEARLQERYPEAHANEGLAALAGMSECNFLRRFKAATGRVPAGYLQAVRIEAAKVMLEREAASIQSVASAVGYEDVAFFRTLFKRATGMTPAEYRDRFAAFNVREPDSVDLTSLV